MPPEWEQKMDRISILARPKVNHQVVFCRPSVYWVDKIPKEQPRYTIPVLTPRQAELSEFKKVHPSYRYNRFPGQSVARAALKAETSPRMEELAQARHYTDVWELIRTDGLVVSKRALAAVPTPRIIALAEPRQHPPVSEKPPKKCTRWMAGPGVFEKLSKPKMYIFEQHNPYKISKGALDYTPSPRILEISRPVRIREKIT